MSIEKKIAVNIALFLEEKNQGILCGVFRRKKNHCIFYGVLYLVMSYEKKKNHRNIEKKIHKLSHLKLLRMLYRPFDTTRKSAIPIILFSA